jgi:signal transduction histidine kinase
VIELLRSSAIQLEGCEVGERSDQPDLLRSVAAAARFALGNARMQAQLRAQVDELRGSRERIVEAAEAERRRIERNLHDGAQQQLIALGMKLDEARRGLRLPEAMSPAAATGALDDAVESLRITLGELQALARGVHPPILTARGLVPAVRSLLDRLPLNITMRVDDPGRLDSAIEAAAYHVISEALTNAMQRLAPDACIVDIRMPPTRTDEGLRAARDPGMETVLNRPGNGDCSRCGLRAL